MESSEIPLMALDQKEPDQAIESMGEVQVHRQQTLPFTAWASQAWRLTVSSGALAGIIVFFANIITFGVMEGEYNPNDHSLAFYTGSCTRTSQITMAAHIIINILSTILLASSNFSMQCLGSPTRKEIDAAHAKQRWLSIGTPTVRNVFFVGRKKAVLWLVLAITSVPLHTFWNSTVFETKTTNNYLAVAVTEGFLGGGNWTVPNSNLDDDGSNVEYQSIVSELQQEVNSSSGLERLSVEDCIKAYSPDKLSDRKHVLLVVDNQINQSENLLAIYNNTYTPSGDPIFNWICKDSSSWSCADDVLKNDVDNWIPSQETTLGNEESAPIHYCYSQPATEQCKASIVPIFLIIVIVCNAIKVACFIITLRITKEDPPLCTTGDAIQSFLQQPDTHLQGRCLVSKFDYETYPMKSKQWNTTSSPSHTGDTWRGGRWRWGKAVYIGQWIFYTCCVSVAIIITGACLNSLVPNAGISPSDIYTLGLGQPRSGFALSHNGVSNLLKAFILANLPQLLISYIYLALNNMMNTMLAMAEWCSYSVYATNQGKPLRVSSPMPNTAQKSTYFLSVPLKWFIPTAITTTVLHWLVSEMMFFSSIDVYPAGNSTGPSSVYNIYISPLAKFIALGTASFSVLAFIAIGLFMKYPDSIPLAGCCSASIAAACQPSRKGEAGFGFPEGLAYKRLQWGVVRDRGDVYGVGHATFAEEAMPLVKGEMYS